MEEDRQAILARQEGQTPDLLVRMEWVAERVVIPPQLGGAEQVVAAVVAGLQRAVTRGDPLLLVVAGVAEAVV